MLSVVWALSRLLATLQLLLWVGTFLLRKVRVGQKMKQQQGGLSRFQRSIIFFVTAELACFLMLAIWFLVAAWVGPVLPFIANSSWWAMYSIYYALVLLASSSVLAVYFRQPAKEDLPRHTRCPAKEHLLVFILSPCSGGSSEKPGTGTVGDVESPPASSSTGTGLSPRVTGEAETTVSRTTETAAALEMVASGTSSSVAAAPQDSSVSAASALPLVETVVSNSAAVESAAASAAAESAAVAAAASAEDSSVVTGIIEL